MLQHDKKWQPIKTPEDIWIVLNTMTSGVFCLFISKCRLSLLVNWEFSFIGQDLRSNTCIWYCWSENVEFVWRVCGYIYYTFFIFSCRKENIQILEYVAHNFTLQDYRKWFISLAKTKVRFLYTRYLPALAHF